MSNYHAEEAVLSQEFDILLKKLQDLELDAHSRKVVSEVLQAIARRLREIDIMLEDFSGPVVDVTYPR